MISDKVNSIYEENINVFARIEKIFYSSHGVPVVITRDNIKQRITAELNGERTQKLLAEKLAGLKGFVTYYTLMLFLILSVFLGGKKKKIKSTVLFDCWQSNSMEFYEGIIGRIKTDSIDFFYSKSSINYSHCSISQLKNFTIKKTIPEILTRSASLEILKHHFLKYFIYWKLSKQTNLNVLDLVLRMIYEAAKHISMSEGINTRILVSAHDNGFSPYRYYFYKKSGIDSVMLLQNGGRVNLDAANNSYIYADYYMAWSNLRLANFTGMNCPNKYAPGSIRLSRCLSKGIYDTKIEYDILFVEQIFNFSDSYGAPNHEAYLEGVNNLVKFKNENNDLRVAYCCRPTKNTNQKKKRIHDIRSRLMTTDIILLEPPPLGIYDEIMHSQCVIAYDSSVRCEALMMEKPVITCNYTGYPNDFVVKNSCDDAVIFSKRYDEFEMKTLSMLNNIGRESVMDCYKEIWGFSGEITGTSEEILKLINSEIIR